MVFGPIANQVRGRFDMRSGLYFWASTSRRQIFVKSSNHILDFGYIIFALSRLCFMFFYILNFENAGLSIWSIDNTNIINSFSTSHSVNFLKNFPLGNKGIYSIFNRRQQKLLITVWYQMHPRESHTDFVRRDVRGGLIATHYFQIQYVNLWTICLFNCGAKWCQLILT